MAFNGTFDHSLDAKNRLTVPSKYRPILSGKLALVQSDDCLSLYPEDVYERMTEQSLARLNPLSAQYRKLSRLFHSRADDIELDGAGRVTLQAHHLEHAGIAGRDCTIAGARDCLEIWDREAWKRYETDLSAESADLTAALDHPA